MTFNVKPAITVLGLLLLAGAPALAQTNQPYQPGGVGMSLGYRQGILNDKLLGSRPKSLVRGPNGELLDLQQQGHQAFLRSPDSGAFIPGARPNSGWIFGLGTGLGWGGGYYQPAFSSGATARYAGFSISGGNIFSWIAMLPAGNGGSHWSGILPTGGGTPINAWIWQLDQS